MARHTPCSLLHQKIPVALRSPHRMQDGQTKTCISPQFNLWQSVFQPVYRKRRKKAVLNDANSIQSTNSLFNARKICEFFLILKLQNVLFYALGHQLKCYISLRLIWQMILRPRKPPSVLLPVKEWDLNISVLISVNEWNSICFQLMIELVSRFQLMHGMVSVSVNEWNGTYCQFMNELVSCFS